MSVRCTSLVRLLPPEKPARRKQNDTETTGQHSVLGADTHQPGLMSRKKCRQRIRGTRKYIAATINRTTPRMVTMAFMLVPPLSTEHSKAAARLSSSVWLFEFERLRRDAMCFFAGRIAVSTAIRTVQHETDVAGAPRPDRISYSRTRSSNTLRSAPPRSATRIRRSQPPVPQKNDARPTHSAS